ncbi:hypothetical protein OH76DRAFT_527367 [Lentinus brumalis]|uniref:Uncharacterized protein n=1 Tax=Lentinus brumalis TaxID=2498619 RepID=A0A371DA14_9APHY|nr:hypothetical protein OH76DRAFT_527367 [Polyporus brumalis]
MPIEVQLGRAGSRAQVAAKLRGLCILPRLLLRVTILAVVVIVIFLRRRRALSPLFSGSLLRPLRTRGSLSYTRDTVNALQHASATERTNTVTTHRYPTTTDPERRPHRPRQTRLLHTSSLYPLTYWTGSRSSRPEEPLQSPLHGLQLRVGFERVLLVKPLPTSSTAIPSIRPRR